MIPNPEITKEMSAKLLKLARGIGDSPPARTTNVEESVDDSDDDLY